MKIVLKICLTILAIILGAQNAVYAISNPFKSKNSTTTFKSKSEAINAMNSAYKKAFGLKFFNYPTGTLFAGANKGQFGGTHVVNLVDWTPFMTKLDAYVAANAQDLAGKSDNVITNYYEKVKHEINNVASNIVLNWHEFMINVASGIDIDGNLEAATLSCNGLYISRKKLHDAAYNDMQLNKLYDDTFTLKRKKDVIDVITSLADLIKATCSSAAAELYAINMKYGNKNTQCRPECFKGEPTAARCEANYNFKH